MTFLATVTITADADTVRPITAAAPGDFLVQLSNSVGELVGQLRGTDLVYTFPGLAEGAYTVRAQLLDADGATIGAVMSAEFTAAPDTVIVKSVSAVSVAVAAE